MWGCELVCSKKCRKKDMPRYRERQKKEDKKNGNVAKPDQWESEGEKAKMRKCEKAEMENKK